jgi:DNA-binding HxlR family transcriptional regulator
MPTPKLGTKVRGSQTGRPTMVILDLLGRRWILRILWELHQNGSSSFRTLQRLCDDISPTVLNTRLKELRESGIVELRDGEGYSITEQGIGLGSIILEIDTWAKIWAEHTTGVKVSQPQKKSSQKSNRLNKKS